jgi:hypothetical protein
VLFILQRCGQYGFHAVFQANADIVCDFVVIRYFVVVDVA